MKPSEVIYCIRAGWNYTWCLARKKFQKRIRNCREGGRQPSAEMSRTSL